MYSFARDHFMVPEDPLGRHGPTLDRFLRHWYQTFVRSFHGSWGPSWQTWAHTRQISTSLISNICEIISWFLRTLLADMGPQWTDFYIIDIKHLWEIISWFLRTFLADMGPHWTDFYVIDIKHLWEIISWFLRTLLADMGPHWTDFYVIDIKHVWEIMSWFLRTLLADIGPHWTDFYVIDIKHLWDHFMVPEDLLGRHGPTLDRFLCHWYQTFVRSFHGSWGPSWQTWAHSGQISTSLISNICERSFHGSWGPSWQTSHTGQIFMSLISNNCCSVINPLASLIWATSWENLFMPYANNKGADQPLLFKTLASLCS